VCQERHHMSRFGHHLHPLTGQEQERRGYAAVQSQPRRELDYGQRIGTTKATEYDDSIACRVWNQFDLIRADHHLHCGGLRQSRGIGKSADLGRDPGSYDAPGDEIGLSHELRHKSAGGPVIDLLGPTELLKSSLMEYPYPIGYHERLILVMSDE